MGQIVVVGGGVGGMAAAARLAKTGHQVTLVERETDLGGSMRVVADGQFRWHPGAAGIVVPAIWRDLFRKSGRPLERYTGLVMQDPARRHVFVDGSFVDLPTGSRGAQIAAIDSGLGSGLGIAWASFLDAQAPVWEALRTGFLDNHGSRQGLPRSPRPGFRRFRGNPVRSSLSDPRLRQVVAYDAGAATIDDIPAAAAFRSYTERTFGVWTAEPGALVRALETRLVERGVEVRTGSAVCAITVRDGVARGVELADATWIRADHVVASVEPRIVLDQLDGADVAVLRKPWCELDTRPIGPVIQLGVESADVPRMPAEVVLHGSPTIVVNTTGSAPAGYAAWTITQRFGTPDGSDLLDVLAARGIDVRAAVVARVDARPVTTASGAGSLGPRAWATVAERASLASAIPRLHVLGAALLPDAGPSDVVWRAASIAAAIGPA